MSVAKAIEEAQRDLADAEKRQVGGQPHRRGDLDPMAGSELGRFVLAHVTVRNCLAAGSPVSIVDLRRETMEAAEAYARAWARWSRAKGVPLPANFAWDLALNGDGESRIEESLPRWREARDRCEGALKCAGLAAFRCAKDLILFDLPVPFGWAGGVRRALQNLHHAAYTR